MATKKKILIRIGSLRHGGAEKVLVTFLKNLPQNRYEIDLLLNLYSGKYLPEVPTWINVLYLNDGAMYVIRSMEKYRDARNFGRIKIGKNCFIGNNCTILPGVEMGDNCILGAGSVLNSSTPPNSVFAGTPAKFICTIEEYGDKALKNNVMYPRELELDRPKLDEYIKENLPQTYKTVKKNQD